MVHGTSEHVAHECSNIVLFRKKIEFDDSFDVTKCIQQIEMPDSLHICAHGVLSHHADPGISA